MDLYLYAVCVVLFAVCTALSTACIALFVLHAISRWRGVAVPFQMVAGDGVLALGLYGLIPFWHFNLRILIQQHNDAAAPELQVHWMLTCLGIMEHVLPFLAVLVQLSNLLDQLGLLKPATRGLSPAQIEALGVAKYEDYINEHGVEGAEVECCVCLSEFVGTESVRMIPGCRHVYHKDCIDKWLSLKSLCPRCNSRSGLPK